MKIPDKKIVCLAASTKNRGLCIAGKEVLGDGTYGGWVRPVSTLPSGELGPDETQYEDGRQPKLLDVIEIPVIGHAPINHQVENVIIDSHSYWTKAGRVHASTLSKILDVPTALWLNMDSTYHGIYDRVPANSAVTLKNSLYLIKPEKVSMKVLQPSISFGDPKRAVRARFTYNRQEYDFTVTDLDVRKRFFAMPDGTYQIEGNIYFCISLAPAHSDGYCYKLVAAVIGEFDAK